MRRSVLRCDSADKRDWANCTIAWADGRRDLENSMSVVFAVRSQCRSERAVRYLRGIFGGVRPTKQCLRPVGVARSEGWRQNCSLGCLKIVINTEQMREKARFLAGLWLLWTFVSTLSYG